MATKFCTVVPIVCGTSVWSLHYVTLLVPRIMRWLLDFWTIYAPCIKSNHTCSSRYVSSLNFGDGTTLFVGKEAWGESDVV
jgi:hypothetical protein